MEDLKQIQEFFSKPLNEISKEDAWKKFQKEKSVTDKTIKVARKDFEKEWEAGNLKENVDKKYSDFLVALRDSGITNMFGAAPYLQAEFGLDKREAREVLANWMRSFGESLKEGTFDQGEIAIYIGHDDSGTTHIFKRGKGYYGYNDEFDFEAASKEELQQMLDKWGYELLAGSLEESVNEAQFTDYSNNELAFYAREKKQQRADYALRCPDPKIVDELDKEIEAITRELKKRSQALKGLTRTDEAKKLTFNDFVRMVRDDMMVGAAPDERPSEELVGKRAKAYYNEYLQGASVDDLFEATKEEENEFHTKLDKLVHKTFGQSSDEKEEMDENIAIQMAIAKAIADRKNKDKKKVKEYNTGIYYDPAKDNPTGRSLKAKEASKTGLEKVKDMLKKIMKEGDITIDDETEFKLQLKHLLDKHAIQKEDLSDYEEKEANYDELYSDYLYKMVKEIAAEKGYSKFLVSKDNPKGETDGLTTATMNKILMNVIKDLDETIKLGKNLNEELCPKGKAYIKKRQAAGEKSSAYLSGRAVKVCKGQMKG